MEYVLYCDESDSSGRYYSNFYGGLLIRSSDLNSVIATLSALKSELNLNKELKWQRVTSNYLPKYLRVVDEVFDLIESRKIKIRIMFTQNMDVPPRYEEYKNDNKYFMLYYQFLKHAFGLHIPKNNPKVRVRLYLDKLPDTKEKVESFKGHIVAMNKSAKYRNAGVYFDREQIAEIDSSEHVLAQVLDIILGSMSFRLNDKHLKKVDGSRNRGKRTIAKEKLYKHINKRIRDIYPNFNVGVSTSIRDNAKNNWLDPYRHWVFSPTGAVRDKTFSKKRKAP